MHPLFMFRVIQIMSLISFSLTAADEPRCSKYDFEEKVLEKLVRIEFQFERFKLEFNEAVAEMKAAKVDNAQYKETVDGILDRLKETVNDNALERRLNDTFEPFKLEFNEAVAEMKATKVDNEQYKDSVNGILSNIKKSADITPLERRLNDTIEAHTRELNTFKSQSSTPAVMFKARTLQDTTLSVNQVFVFTTVDHDTGKNYNPSNGEFIVPVSGTYMFGVTVCISSGGCVVGLLVDDKKIIVEVAYNNGNAPCFSYSTVESLSKGQRVFVKNLPGSSSCTINQSDAYIWNTFYGVLVAK